MPVPQDVIKQLNYFCKSRILQIINKQYSVTESDYPKIYEQIGQSYIPVLRLIIKNYLGRLLM